MILHNGQCDLRPVKYSGGHMIRFFLGGAGWHYNCTSRKKMKFSHCEMRFNREINSEFNCFERQFSLFGNSLKITGIPFTLQKLRLAQ